MPVPTPHIEALYGDFAPTVIMPGDPRRARFIAENFLSGAVLVNSVRGMDGFTGSYKGERISVMASGMGGPSVGIYSYELFNFYGVENIIRTGSCGAIDPSLHVRDIVIALGACTNGNFASQYNLPGTLCPTASYRLIRALTDSLDRTKVKYKVGNVLSSDFFYDDADSALAWCKMGVLGIEMECAALYCNALRAGKNAAAVCTVSDSFIYPKENLDAIERQNSFTDMMSAALDAAIML